MKKNVLKKRMEKECSSKTCTKKKFLPRAAFLAALTASVYLVSACGSGSFSKASAQIDMEAAAETAAAGARADDYYYSGEKAENLSTDNTASYEEGLTGSESYSVEKPAVQANRKLIRNINMEVETNDFDALLSEINNKITALGGYLEQSNISGRRAGYQNQPYPRSAIMTARIPSDKLDRFVTSVEEAGNVVNKYQTTEDVTLKYSDIESRKKSLTIEQDRLWALLEKADTLEAVIALEQRLSDIRYELESMESQLKLYDNQVDYSTVILDISEVIEYTPTAPETVSQRINRGFSNTVDSLSAFLVNLFVFLVSSSPVWIPAGIIALIVFLTVRSKLRGKHSLPSKDKLKNNQPDKKEDREDKKQS